MMRTSVRLKNNNFFSHAADFSSKEKAQEKIKDYKKLEGFRDHPEGFCVNEYIIDEIDKKSLSQLIKNYESR